MRVLRNELYRPWFVGEQTWGFEIIDGEFKDVVVQIEKIEFAEEQTSGDNMSVDYHIVFKPSIVEKEDIEGPIFKEIFSTIVTDIISEAVANVENNLNEQNRNDNP